MNSPREASIEAKGTQEKTDESLKPSVKDASALNKDLDLADGEAARDYMAQAIDEERSKAARHPKRRRASSNKSKGSMGTKLTSIKGSRSPSRGRSINDVTFVPRVGSTLPSDKQKKAAFAINDSLQQLPFRDNVYGLDQDGSSPTLSFQKKKRSAAHINSNRDPIHMGIYEPINEVTDYHGGVVSIEQRLNSEQLLEDSL